MLESSVQSGQLIVILEGGLSNSFAGGLLIFETSRTRLINLERRRVK